MVWSLPESEKAPGIVRGYHVDEQEKVVLGKVILRFFSLPSQAGTEEAIPKDGNSIGVQHTKGRRAVLERNKISQRPNVILSQNDGEHSRSHFRLKCQKIGDC